MHHTGTKEVKKRFKKRNEKKERKKKATKNLLQGDLNPYPQNQLELKVNAFLHWNTSVNADNSSLKEVFIPSFQGPLFRFFLFNFRLDLNP